MKKNLDVILLLSAVGATAFYVFYLKPRLKQREKEKSEEKFMQDVQDVRDGKKTATEVFGDNFALYGYTKSGMPCYVPPCGMYDAYSNLPANQEFLDTLKNNATNS